jgi:hypothetical protein
MWNDVPQTPSKLDKHKNCVYAPLVSLINRDKHKKYANNLRISSNQTFLHDLSIKFVLIPLISLNGKIISTDLVLREEMLSLFYSLRQCITHFFTCDFHQPKLGPTDNNCFGAIFGTAFFKLIDYESTILLLGHIDKIHYNNAG